MADSNIASIGRFSSQMLSYLGTQRTVQITPGGQYSNTFMYSTGNTPVFPSPDSYQQANLGQGVVGNYSPAVFDSTRCFFISRGASAVYADTMAALAIDIAAILGISPQAYLEKITAGAQLLITDDAYMAFNNLRDPGNQVGTATSVNNKYSLQARQILG